MSKPQVVVKKRRGHTLWQLQGPLHHSKHEAHRAFARPRETSTSSVFTECRLRESGQNLLSVSEVWAVAVDRDKDRIPLVEIRRRCEEAIDDVVRLPRNVLKNGRRADPEEKGEASKMVASGSTLSTVPRRTAPATACDRGAGGQPPQPGNAVPPSWRTR